MSDFEPDHIGASPSAVNDLIAEERRKKIALAVIKHKGKTEEKTAMSRGPWKKKGPGRPPKSEAIEPEELDVERVPKKRGPKPKKLVAAARRTPPCEGSLSGIKALASQLLEAVEAYEARVSEIL